MSNNAELISPPNNDRFLYPQAVKRKRDDERQSMNSRQMTFSMCAMIIFLFFFGIFAFVCMVLYSLAVNAVPLGVIGGLYYGSLQLRHEGEILINAINTNNVHEQQQFLDYIVPIQQVYDVLLNLLDVCIILWDYSVGLFIFIMTLFFNLMVPILIYCISQFGNIFMELLLMLASMAEILAQDFAVIMNGLAGSGATSGATAAAAGTAGAAGAAYGGAEEAILRPVSNLLLKFGQVIAAGITDLFFYLGHASLFVADMINLMLKYFAVISQVAMYLAQLFNPGNLLADFLYGIGFLIFEVEKVLYGNCQTIQMILRSICSAYAGFVGPFNQVAGALNSIPGVSIRLNLPPSCNAGSITSFCSVPPSNPFSSTSGVGICNAAQCEQDVISIIALLQEQMPTCANWVAPVGAESTIQCMNIVYQFSQTNSSSTASSSIDSISKELCFVMTATIVFQCNNALPPFGFSFADVANEICVTDKSGLSPPLPPFNDDCACVYAAPLCNAQCCNQYSLHVIGQVKSYIGGYQCGTLLAQFPYDFWCQYTTLSSADMPPHTDLTFSSDWCAAFTLVIQPACAASSPNIKLDAIDLSSLVPAYSSHFCQSTLNQTGVCVRIDTTTDASVLNFQYEQSMMIVTGVYGANNIANPLGFQGQIIDTTPTLNSTTAEVLQMDVEQYYCFYFSLIFNSSNPIFASRQKSILKSVGAYCDGALAAAYGGFQFTNMLYSKLLTTSGAPIPVNLIGIPPNVLVFDGIAGVGTTTSATDNSNNGTSGDNINNPLNPGVCGYTTAYTAPEIAQQSQCNSVALSGAYNATSLMGTNGVQGQEALGVNAQTQQPVLHLTGQQPVNPNSPNAAQQQQEQQTQQSAVQVSSSASSSYYTAPAAKTPDTTSNYRTIYTQGSTLLNTQYVGRSVLSVSSRNNSADINVNIEEHVQTDYAFMNSKLYEQIEIARREDDARRMPGGAEEDVHWSLRVARQIMDVYTRLGAASEKMSMEARRIMESARIQDPNSARDDPMFGTERARKGQRRLMATLRMIDDERRDIKRKGLRRGDPQIFARTRKLLGGTWNISDYAIHIDMDAFWSKIADLELTNQNVDEAELEKILTQRALNDAKYLFKYTTQVMIPNVYNYWYNGNFSRDVKYDYAYSGQGTDGYTPAGGGSGTCQSTWANPLAGCTANTPPEQCCCGLKPLCLPRVNVILYWTVTTPETIDTWLCTPFVSYGDWWINVIRTLTTYLVDILQYEIGSSSTSILNKLLGWIVYPGLVTPVNAVPCIIWYSSTLWITLLGLWLLFVFIATQTFVEILIVITTRAEVITNVEMASMMRYSISQTNEKLDALIGRSPLKAPPPKPAPKSGGGGGGSSASSFGIGLGGLF